MKVCVSIAIRSRPVVGKGLNIPPVALAITDFLSFKPDLQAVSFFIMSNRWWRWASYRLKLFSQVLTLRKIAIWLSKNCQKLDIFSKKISKNLIFFKKLPLAIFLKKMSCFWQFLDIQMAIFRRVRTWHSFVNPKKAKP